MKIFLKFLLFSLTLLSVTNCTFTVIDPRTPAEATATNEARSSLIPTVTIEPQIVPDDVVVPEEEVGDLDPVPTLPPPSLDIKGNISSSGEKIYHMPDGAYYDQVKIDESAGERWFRSEEEAQAAGWRRSTR